ncbi:testin [Anguilla rostrata]|uniref:testin n=1 Tax=Anguilla rostrata TaxID=7938 RepID=UPI0030CBD7AE
MEVEKEIKKMTLGHEIGAGAACLKCKEKCEGFELHFWRKICRNCKCGLEDHDVQMGTAEDRKVGRLFEDTKYTGLMAKLKKDGVPSYGGAMVTLPTTLPVSAIPISTAHASAVPMNAASASAMPARVAPASGLPAKAAPANATPATTVPAKATPSSTVANATPISATLAKKDVPVMTATYEWVPPVANQCLVVRYIELLPVEKRPVVGSEGAAYRKKQMAKQLPEHDQDPSKCHELSPNEVRQMEQYVKKYKEDALGMGDLVLPEEMSQVQPQAGGKGGSGAGAGAGAGGPAGAGPGAGVEAGPGGAAGSRGMTAAVGALGTPRAPGGPAGQTYSCSHCQKPMKEGEPAVYAERAGYDNLWHPACFVCCTCTELLVDMIYFWKKGKLYCGRHYGDSEKPRCGGCDELIFSNEYTQAEGQNWHLKHFCCFDCDCVLAGETYVMENEKPVCKPCYMKSHAVCCTACQNPIEPEAQRVSYGDHHWHAEPDCFQCSCCSKCLMGQRFMALQGMLFCSVECKKKAMA